ncbi:DMT family transporter [Flectobacillus major]|uniref:DMT family transporter n=1 Tax=Flectobacillus major TaxID=103 RepID=UPI000425A702|nr:SMR family transporter [Flectobacillus major]
MHWLYLSIAALFEAAWTYSLKYLDFKHIKNLAWTSLFSAESWSVISPLLGYIVFGIGNIYFFSLSLKFVSTAVAMAVWTALTLLFIKLADVYIMGEKLIWQEVFFMLLITIGIIGLKVYSKS